MSDQGKGDIRLTIRISNTLHKDLGELAITDHRNIGQEIAWLLERSVAEEKARRPGVSGQQSTQEAEQ